MYNNLEATSLTMVNTVELLHQMAAKLAEV